MTSVAIIGAGLSGLTLAHLLSKKFDVDVFEKSSKPGGRMASRANHDRVFDHGAQFFTVKTPEFASFLSPLIQAGVVKDWQARFIELDKQRIVSSREWTEEFPHYVGFPEMASIGEWLSRDISVYYDHQVSGLRQDNEKWLLSATNGWLSKPYDWVIVASPVKQTADLLPEQIRFKPDLADISMLPCYAMMVTLDDDPGFAFDAALVKNTNISWVSVNHSKPGRHGYSLVVHASNAWAAENADLPLDTVRQAMLDTVVELTGLRPEIVAHCEVKHWHYANIARHESGPYFIDHDHHIAACGDWCIAGRIEAAFTSASRLAAQLSDAIPSGNNTSE